MNLTEIVIDESVDYSIIKKLRSKGFTVYAISEQAPSLPDEKVLSAAVEKSALLITEDKDFGELVYRFQLPHRGILLIRMTEASSEEKAINTYNAIHKYGSRLLDCFTVLDNKKLRIRK